jgi:predicted MPP superfamily phosphohydrolase
VRLLLLLALLIAFKIGRDFYRHYYYTDDIPRFGELGRILRESPGHWSLERIRQVVQGESFREKLAPRIRVAAFVLFVWIVLFWAGATLVYEYVFHFATRGERRNRFAPYVWLRRLILSAGAAGVLCLLYGFFVEPYWLEVTHISVATSKLPRGAQPIRIVHISDLHMARKVRLEPRLPGVIAAQHPDLIVFTGDAMNSSWALGRFKQFLLTMNDIAPVFLVRGNQDGGPFLEPKNIYFGTRAHELQDNEPQTIAIRGTELWLRGAHYNGIGPHLTPAAPPPSPQAFTIFLSHSVEYLPDVVDQGMELYLCGHSHGGQIALPFYGALITYARFDKQYEAGRYQVNGTTLYVNRGIGFAKWPQPEARFFARPEITVIDLVGQ